MVDCIVSAFYLIHSIKRFIWLEISERQRDLEVCMRALVGDLIGTIKWEFVVKVSLLGRRES